MLWKYKKCYQETNEDVIDPTRCVKLVSITSKDSMGEIFYSYVDCETGEEVKRSFIKTTGILNICIKANRLFIMNGESVAIVFDSCK